MAPTLHRRNMSQRSAPAQRGVVYVEVLICFFPVLLTFLAICQISLLFAAQTIVQHAATRAARAAMVVLEDDPERYDGAPRGDLMSGSGSSEQGLPQQLAAQQGAEPTGENLSEFNVDALRSASADPSAATDGTSRPASGDASNVASGARMAAIRAAAYHPLAVLAPSMASLPQPTLETAVAKGALDRILLGRFVYNLGGAAITLHAPGEDEVLTRIGKRDPVTVRVAYVMPCGVPLVSALMCTGRMDLLAGALGLGEDDAQELLERMEFAESSSIRNLIFGVIPRVKLLTAEATMPNQGADYYGSDP